MERGINGGSLGCCNREKYDWECQRLVQLINERECGRKPQSYSEDTKESDV